MILNGFTLMRIVFIHTFSVSTLHDCFWILGRDYLRLHISYYYRAHPIFVGLRRVPSGVILLSLIVFIDLIILVDLFNIASVWI